MNFTSLSIAFAASLALTAAWRRFALSRKIVDIPTERSSHRAPTPSGGGVAIVCVFLLSIGALWLWGGFPANLAAALVGGGLLIGSVGLVDDLIDVPPVVRAVVHFVAAGWSVAWLGGMPALEFGSRQSSMGLGGDLIAVVGLVWLVNLYNFMDGIDGLAAMEGVFVSLAGGIMLAAGARSAWLPSLLLAAVTAGFLVWNWPPAKVFMGDVGSGFLGFTIGVLALASQSGGGPPVWTWVVLLGLFVVDATLTLVVRFSRGEAWYRPHRTHAYQQLARQWASHRRVTVTALVVNICWLLPWAVLAWRFPMQGWWLMLVALLPLVWAAAAIGGGGGSIERVAERDQ